MLEEEGAAVRSLTVLALLLVVTLAGCSDADPEPAPALDDLASTPTTGLIRGVVLDETITPVADATVSLRGGNETVTDLDGRFGFGSLEPGTYFLAVQKPGHESVETSTTVVVGVDQPAVVKVTLPRLPETIPYILPIQVSGLINCEAMLVILLETCDQGTGLAGSGQSQFFLPVDQKVPHAVQVELQWDATQATGGSMTLTFGACPDGEYCSPYDFGVNNLCQTWGPSVLWCRSDQYTVERSGAGVGGDSVGQARLGIGDEPGIAIAVGADCAVCTPPGTPQCGDACGVGVILEQEFEIFAHVFYNFTPDEGWVFTEDGPHSPPS